MAVLADGDGYDLWLEPTVWTSEEREEVRRFIESRRQRETDPQFAEKAAALLARIRASAVRSSSLVETGP